MADGDAHRFRFFSTNMGFPGTRVELSTSDAAHLSVLRLAVGDAVELVDASGIVWDAQVAADGLVTLRLPLPIDDARVLPRIDLVAGALVGGRFDELVDGAVQAGASSVRPFVGNRKDAARLTERQERLQRIATAAAKQAKRREVPHVAAPIDRAALLQGAPGIVLDADAEPTLMALLQDDARPHPEQTGVGWTLLVGPAEGFAPELIRELVAAGWRAARLGPTVLRAELAAAVAVAMVATHAAR